MSQTDKKQQVSSPLSKDSPLEKRKMTDCSVSDGTKEKKQKISLDEKTTEKVTPQQRKRTPLEEKELLLKMKDEQLKKLELARLEVEQARETLEEKNTNVKSIESTIQHQENQIYGTELKQFYLEKKPDAPKKAYFMGAWFESMKGSMIKKLTNEGTLLKLRNAITINYYKKEVEDDDEDGKATPGFELDDSSHEGLSFKRELEAMIGVKIVLDDLKVQEIYRIDNRKKKDTEKEEEEGEEAGNDDDDDFVVSDGDDENDGDYEEEEGDGKKRQDQKSTLLQKKHKKREGAAKKKKHQVDELEDDLDKEDVYDALFGGLSIVNRRKIEVELLKFLKKSGVQHVSFRFWNYHPKQTLDIEHDFESSALSKDENDMSFADFYPVTVLII